MEQIGYIYKYNEQEKKGILVYGCRSWSFYSKKSPWNKPIKFSLTDCISNIATGQLVYFNLINEYTASGIEHASLCNFKRNIIESVNSPSICFENLLDEDLFGQSAIQILPESIDRLYKLFGTLRHLSFDLPELDIEDTSSLYIRIFDIDYWINEDIYIGKDYYGKTAEQLLDLVHIFTEKCNQKLGNVVNSSGWKLLLSLLLENELKKVFSIEKGFQPILPDSFCLKNLKELSANYGFPSASVCVAFYRNYISKLQTITEYSCVFQEINDAIQTKEGNSQEHQGVFLHQLEQKELDSLQKLLEEQYLATILANLKKSLSLISGNKINGDQKVNELISKNNKKYIVKLGHFVDNYKSIKENIRNNSECFNIGNLVGSYYELLASDRKNLNVLMKNITCEYVLYIAQNGMKDKVFMLYHALQDYSQWISSQIISQIKELVNIEFSKLSKLDELEYAYKGNFISVEQYLEQYKLLTCNYELKQLYEIIQNNYGESLPLFIQEYLINRVSSLMFPI